MIDISKDTAGAFLGVPTMMQKIFIRHSHKEIKDTEKDRYDSITSDADDFHHFLLALSFMLARIQLFDTSTFCPHNIAIIAYFPVLPIF